MMNLRIYLKSEDYADQVAIYLVERDERGLTRRTAKPVQLEWVELEPGESSRDEDRAFLRLSGYHGSQFLKELANALAEAGYRPDTNREAGELMATKGHLEREKFHADGLASMLRRFLPRDES